MIRFIITLTLLVSPLVARAGFLDALGCVKYGNCGLDDIGTGFVLLIRLMLGGMGAIALVYFVYGGVQWLISSGNSERVKKGKDIMINTIFAIIVAFGGYLILDFFVNNVLNVKDEYRITQDSCQGQPALTQCGIRGDAKVCAGIFIGDQLAQFNEACVTRCVYDGILNNDQRACLTVGYNPQDYAGAVPVEGCATCCPSGNVCVSFGQQIIQNPSQ